ncbi:MAG TPA: hypothetical protein PL009_05100 [Flavipsychrobacter sp.]|nr:hypothetical protein [Flavipsychrobacter sp.]
MQLSVSPVEDLREHNIYALSLLNVYLLLLEGEMLPGYHLPEFLKRISVRMLMAKMESSKKAEELNLNHDELKTIYAAYILGNKLLTSSRGEYLSGMILQQIPAGHELKDPGRFQSTMITNNAALAKFTDDQFAENFEIFSEWKINLEGFVVE